MARRRRPPSRGRASAQSLDSWPLDQPTPTPAPDPEPAPASESATWRLSSSPPPSRPGDAFYCRHCRRREVAPEPPAGWWRVQQRHPDPEHVSSRLYGTVGLFCSVGCLVAEATAWQARGEATG